MSHSIKICCLALLLTTLSSCGFTLRGSNDAMVNDLSVTLNSERANDATTVQVKQALEQLGLTVMSQGAADYTLALSSERFNARPSSVNGRARAAQYELTLAIDYSLQDANALLIPQESIAASRTYFEDLANISGSSEEQELLRQEMRAELVDRLIRRVVASANSTSP